MDAKIVTQHPAQILKVQKFHLSNNLVKGALKRKRLKGARAR